MDKPLIITSSSLTASTPAMANDDSSEIIHHPRMPGLTIRGKRIRAGEHIPSGAFFSAPGPIWKPVHTSLFNMLVGENARDVYVLPSPDYFLSAAKIISSESESS